MCKGGADAQKILVVTYSYTGNTRTVSRALAERLGTDTGEIADLSQKHGPMPYVLTGFQALRRRLTRSVPPTHDPSAYDLVILGSPVYAENIPSPVRTYLQQQKAKLKDATFFVTSGDPNNAQVLDALAAPVAGRPAPPSSSRRRMWSAKAIRRRWRVSAPSSRASSSQSIAR